MQTITFYSYKGGLGRTLAVANVARYLSLFGKNVFAVDFDLEAPGLHYKLHLGGGEWRIERGLVDYIHAFVLGKEPEGLQGYVIEVDRKSPPEGSIHILPAGAVPSSEYWQKLARINWHDLFYSENAKGIPFFLELKAQIAEEFAPDYLLIDARTGITEVGGIATTLLADVVVCLLLNNRENLEGAREVLRGIRRAARLPRQAKVEIVPVVARLPELKDRQQEERILEEVRTFLNEEAPDLESTLSVEDVFLLHVDPELQLQESLRIGGAQGPEESVLLRDYLRLFARLIPSLFTEWDPVLVRERLKTAKEVCHLAVAGFTFLRKCAPELIEAVQRGCLLRCVLANPEDFGTPREAAFLHGEQIVAWRELQEIASHVRRGGSVQLRVKESVIDPIMTIIDPKDEEGTMLVTLSGFKQSLSARPSLMSHRTSNSESFEFFHHSFERIWENARPVDLASGKIGD